MHAPSVPHVPSYLPPPQAEGGDTRLRGNDEVVFEQADNFFAVNPAISQFIITVNGHCHSTVNQSI